MKPHTRVFRYALTGLVACMTLTGCNRVGPLSIDEGRMRYKDVIEHTAQTQLLLNLVRVSQNRAPLFIDVTEVDASMTFSSSLSAAATGLGIGKKSGTFRVGSLTSGSVAASMGYAESPTVRYIPLQGQALIQQLAAPISMESLPQLYDADVPLPTLLDFTVDRLTPGYYDYAAALNVIGQLDWIGAITIGSAAARGEAKATGPAESSPKAAVVVQTVTPPPPRHTALVLYLQAGSLTCHDTLQAARLWAQLLGIYATVRTEAENADRRTLENLLAPVKGCAGERLVMLSPGQSTTLQALTNALQKVPFVELRTEPLKVPANVSRSNEVADPAPFLRMRSAYGIFRSIEISDYGPTELIEIVKPEDQAAIAGMAWDDDQLFHLFAFRQYCAPGKPINAAKCKELGEIYQGHPGPIWDAMDRQICQHGRHIRQLAESDPADQELQDKLRRFNQFCGRYTFASSDVIDESLAPPPLLTMSENDTSGPTTLTEDRRVEERLLRKQRRYILIVTSPTLPPDAFASVEVDGNYYYIAKDDAISQKNFRLLQLISVMESVAPAAPLTPTVSVGGH